MSNYQRKVCNCDLDIEKHQKIFDHITSKGEKKQSSYIRDLVWADMHKQDSINEEHIYEAVEKSLNEMCKEGASSGVEGIFRKVIKEELNSVLTAFLNKTISSGFDIEQLSNTNREISHDQEIDYTMIDQEIEDNPVKEELAATEEPIINENPPMRHLLGTFIDRKKRMS